MKLDDLIKNLTEMRANWGNLDVRVRERYIGGYDYVEPSITVVKPAKTNEKIICVE